MSWIACTMPLVEDEDGMLKSGLYSFLVIVHA